MESELVFATKEPTRNEIFKELQWLEALLADVIERDLDDLREDICHDSYHCASNIAEHLADYFMHMDRIHDILQRQAAYDRYKKDPNNSGLLTEWPEVQKGA